MTVVYINTGDASMVHGRTTRLHVQVFLYKLDYRYLKHTPANNTLTHTRQEVKRERERENVRPTIAAYN